LSEETLGHYRIVECIGQGGMGQVYKAWDERLQRTVALKMLPPEHSEVPRRRRRLLREAQMVSALRHPAIVSVLEFATLGNRDALVLEWVDGATLQELSQERPWELAQILEVSVEIAEALASAHGAGITHRDLKPSNIMVDRSGRVRILDFGIAQRESKSAEETLTEPTWRTGEHPGTPGYMSPEQALGEPIDSRTDIFSLGIVIYQMLTGVLPFPGKTPQVRLAQLLSHPPVAPSSHRPAIPPALDALVLAMLAKARQERPQRMQDVAATLGDISRKVRNPREPQAPRRVSLPPWRRVAALAIFGIAAIWTTVFVRDQASIPGNHEAVVSGRTASLAGTAHEHNQEGLALLHRHDRVNALDQAQDHFREAIALEPTSALAHSGLARVYWRRFRGKKDPVWHGRALAAAREAVEIDPHLHHGRVSLALALIAGGDLAQAREELDRVLQLDPDHAGAFRALAEIELHQGHWEEAVPHLMKVIELQPDPWEPYSELGIAYIRSSRLEAGQAALEASLHRAPDNAFTRLNLAVVHHFQGDYPAAIAELQRAIAIRPSVMAYSNLGTLYFFQGLYREAAQAFESARDLGASRYELWANLADAYRQLPGRETDATAALLRAVQLLQQDISHRKGADPQRASKLALYLARLGQLQEAQTLMVPLEPLETQTADTQFRAALVYELAGDREHALHALGLALASRYPIREVQREPDLADLRLDVRYHRLMTGLDPPASG